MYPRLALLDAIEPESWQGNLQFHVRYKTGGGPSAGLSYYYSGYPSVRPF